MSSEKSPTNVIQFPGKKKEAEKAPIPAQPSSPPPVPKGNGKTMAAGVLAIFMATIAVNHHIYSSPEQSLDLASNASGGRGIASTSRMDWERDSEWEKQTAERLASAQIRGLASSQIGRAATKHEKLRWGALEEKYTISYSVEDQRIETILLQDSASDPAYVLDRAKFLTEYGILLNAGYNSSKLTSVQSSADKTIESYTLFDKNQVPQGEAKFELDRHKRLISLKVEPLKI